MKSQIDKKTFDWVLFLLILALLGIGVSMCASASYVRSSYMTTKINASTLMLKQIGMSVLGLVLMLILSFVDYKIFKKFAAWIYLVGVALNLYTAFFGAEELGARRWLSIAGHNILQPSEAMKFAMIVYLAAVFTDDEYGEKAKGIRGFLPVIIPYAIGCGSVLLQKHTSATIIIASIGIIIMFTAGIKWDFIGLCGCIGALGFGGIYLVKPDLFNHIGKRLEAYTHTVFGFVHDTEEIEASSIEQIQNSLWAIGSGGLFGKGYGESIQKYSYLSECYNDFIFAICAEELGYVGVAVIIILFMLFLLRGIKIAGSADDKFGMLMATGIVSMVGIQMFLNLAVVSCLIPVTGVSLPFFSYGGTAMVILLCMMGILLNIAKQSNYSKIGRL